MNRISISGIAASLFLFAAPLRASDWPHWLGPNGNSIAPAAGKDISDLADWKVAWQANVGHGYSAVSVSNGRAYTLGHDGKSQETVYCFDAATGDLQWKHSYNAELLPRMHPGGPNASPTIHNGRVYTLSKDGQALCLEEKTGDMVWRANLIQAMGIELPQWGFASSPMIFGDAVLFSAGKVAALDASDGKLLWASKEAHHPGYGTPVPFTSDDKDFIAAFDGKGFSILSEESGQELARNPYQAQFDLTAMTPIVLQQGKRIFISANTGAVMFGFEDGSLTEQWKSRELKNAMNNSLPFNGLLFGIDGAQNSSASRLVCLNPEDGSINWARDRFGYGTLIGVGNNLLVLTENGELVTVNPSPERYTEISRKPVLEKTCWTQPVYANGRIYLRNDRGDLACLTGS